MYEFLLSFGVVLWLAVGVFYIQRPVASMYHPLTYYLLVHGLIFVIRPILAYHFDFNGLYILYDFLPSMEEKSIVLAGADLGLVAFALASLRFGGTILVIKPTMADQYLQKGIVKSFLIVCVICVPIAVYSLYSGLNGQTGEMALDAASGIRYNVNGNGYFSDAQLMLVPICALFAWVFRFKLWSFIPFIIYLGAKSSTGARGAFVSSALALALLFYYTGRKKWPNWKVLPLVVGVIALFSIVGNDRGVVRNFLSGEKTNSYQGVNAARPLESMDYANMEFFEYLVYVVPHKSGTYGYFLDNLQLFTEPVPRVLWHGKPLGAPIQMIDLFAYGTPIGMTLSVPGEGWAQAGWIGIVLWCGLFGAFYGKMYDLFAKSRQDFFQIALYITFLAETVVTFRDGVLISVVKASLFVVVPVVLWRIVSRIYARR